MRQKGTHFQLTRECWKFFIIRCWKGKPSSETKSIKRLKAYHKINFLKTLKNIFYLFSFRARGREGEREGEKHPCVVVSCVLLTGDLAHNPGMCPDQESKSQTFGSQVRAQPTEPDQPGLSVYCGLKHSVMG